MRADPAISPSFDGEIVDGLILSDGSLSVSTDGTVNAKYTQTCKEPSFLSWVASYLPNHSELHGPYKRFSEARQKWYTFYNLLSRVHTYYTLQKERWYKDGIKIVPEDFKITPRSLLAEYIGDGYIRHRSSTNDTITGVYLCTDGFQKREVESIVDRLRTIGFLANIQRRRSEEFDEFVEEYDPNRLFWRVRIAAKSAGDFLDFIGACPLPAYAYKWQGRVTGLRLSESDMKLAFTLKAQGVTTPELATKFGISRTHMWKILKKPFIPLKLRPRKLPNILSDQELLNLFTLYDSGEVPVPELVTKFNVSSAYIYKQLTERRMNSITQRICIYMS